MDPDWRIASDGGWAACGEIGCGTLCGQRSAQLASDSRLPLLSGSENLGLPIFDLLLLWSLVILLPYRRVFAA